MTYIKQLDSIRAIAVLLVIITHWFPETSRINTYTGIFNGVDIFFVLSGFLITTILLNNRNVAEQHNTEKMEVVKNFYLRRSLRIFPIYYLTLFVLYLNGPATGTSIRETFVYFVTYTSNIHFFSTGRWDGMLSHLWSLSVEEQFYLLWPWLMLYAGRKYLLHVILGSIAVGIITQLLLRNHVFGDIFTLSCFDGFGCGALLAWCAAYAPRGIRTYYPHISCLAIGALLLQLLRVTDHSSLIPSRTLTSIITVWVIASIILQKRSQLTNIILDNPALIFIGKISYGVYLYHLIIPYVTYEAFTALNANLPSYISKYNAYLLIVENFALLMLTAFISWKLIEQPALKLKSRFSYVPPVPVKS